MTVPVGELAGTRALVTGSAGGIGSAICGALADAGLDCSYREGACATVCGDRAASKPAPVGKTRSRCGTFCRLKVSVAAVSPAITMTG